MNEKDNVNMEYEARVMIPENQYSLIKEFYLKSGKKYHELVNINYYYDDDKLTISNSHQVLRLREVDNNKNELTLKIRAENGDIEINRPLTSKELHDLLDQINISDEEIINRLKSIGVQLEDLKLVAKLKTERIEIQEDNYLFVIDKNYHNDRVDYDLEVESTSKDAAIHYLKEIIKQFDIEYKKDYISKSRRAIYNL